MTKRIVTYDNWSGGINNKAAPRKIQANQVVDLVNLMVDKPGKVHTMGQMTGYAYGSPLPPTNLVVDWDSEIGVTKDGSNNISQWDGRDSDSVTISASEGTNQPLYMANQINSIYPAIRFDESNSEKLVGNDLADNFNGNDTSFTAYMVLKMNDVSATRNIWGFAAGGATANHVYQMQLFENTIDDFEDGNTTGWTGNTGQFSAVVSPTLEGSYCGELTTDGNANYTVTSPSNTLTNGKTTFIFRANYPPGTSSDFYRIIFYDSSGTRLGYIQWYSNGDVKWEGSSLIDSYVKDTNYGWEMVWDFTNDQVEISVDGNSKGTFAFANSVSNFDYLVLRNDHSTGGGSGYMFYIDSVNNDLPAYRYIRTADGGGVKSASGGIPETGNFHCETLVFDGTVPTATLRIDGVQVVSSTVDVGTITADTFWIGGMEQSTNWSDMDLVRLVFYNEAHGAYQYTEIETQLKRKYGL